MSRVTLMPHQNLLVQKANKFKNVLLTVDMGLGKTDTALTLAEKAGYPVLILCQSTKTDDWEKVAKLYDIDFLVYSIDTAWRRSKDLLKLNSIDFTLIIDESQQIKNLGTKKKPVRRTSFIVNELDPAKTIMLSGTPFDRWEDAYTQFFMLGNNISEREFKNRYCIEYLKKAAGGKRKFYDIVGYKNIDELERLFRATGQITMSYEEAAALSPQMAQIPPAAALQIIPVESTTEYRQFRRDRVIFYPDGSYLKAETISKYRHGERQFASTWNQNKLKVLKELIESTNRRIIIFYNYRQDADEIFKICSDLMRPVSEVNGQRKDLSAYEKYANSVTMVQYQSGARGLDLQKANVTIYFSLTDSVELYTQSFKRTHRPGQNKICRYYLLETKNSIDEDIRAAMERGQDFTEQLFKQIRGIE